MMANKSVSWSIDAGLYAAARSGAKNDEDFRLLARLREGVGTDNDFMRAMLLVAAAGDVDTAESMLGMLFQEAGR